jgi:HK97 family phage major capsid protein
MLKFELPMRWHNGASYLMNQRTAALLLTTGNAMGRPLLQALPQGQTAFALAGSPIVIANQMPTYSPARRPIAFGN